MHTITNCSMRWGKRFLIAVVLAGLAVQTACQSPPSQPFLATEEIIIPEQTPLPTPTITNPLEIYLDVHRGNVLLNGQPFVSGLVKEGDVITTGPDGFAWLYFYGDKLITVDVKPGTTLLVEKITPETARVFLEVGSLLSKVRSSYGIDFVIATKTVEVMAKGTDFGTEVDPEGNVEVTGLDGEVEVRSVDGTIAIVGENQNVGGTPDGNLGSVRDVIPVAFDAAYEDLTDQAWDLTLEGDCSIFGDVMKQAGFEPIKVYDLSDLDQYQILILKFPDYPLTDWDIKTIQTWVDSGNGLFVIGELPSTYNWDSLNMLLSPYGIYLTGEDIISNSLIASFPITHPVTANIKALGLDNYGPFQGGIGLGYDPEGRIVISVNEGIGRVLALADGTVFNNENIVRNDEIIFLQDALKWLAGSGN